MNRTLTAISLIPEATVSASGHGPFATGQI